MIIFISGSRKGIGRYLAEHYLRTGHIVLGCGRSESDLIHENYYHFLADVSNESAVKGMIDIIKQKFEVVDVLINNAGIASMNHFLLIPTETAARVMSVNFLGTFIMCREFARLIRKSKNGRIINFSTIAKPFSLEGESVYVASKAAVESLTITLAKELSSFNITVNAVGPTPLETDLIKGVPEEKINELISRQGIKRMGKFEDVLNVIDFFIKPESTFITGQIVYLGGVS